MEETYRRRTKRQNEEEPEFTVNKLAKFQSYQLTKEQNIYPTCENGGIFECEQNESNESLPENCKESLKGDLMFTSEKFTEDNSCSCQALTQGSNRKKRNSENIKRAGWTIYSR